MDMSIPPRARRAWARVRLGVSEAASALCTRIRDRRREGLPDSLTREQLAAAIAEAWRSSPRYRLTQPPSPLRAWQTEVRARQTYLAAHKGVDAVSAARALRSSRSAAARRTA